MNAEQLRASIRELAAAAQQSAGRHYGEDDGELWDMAARLMRVADEPGQVARGVPDVLEQIANEPPINGNSIAQARVLMKAAELRASAPPAPQADRSGCTAGTDEECKHRQCAAQCPKRAQIGRDAPDEQRMRNLLARYENQWHRMGELWERCQGKGWPEAESKEFARLRDELTPVTRALLLACAQPAPQQIGLDAKPCPTCESLARAVMLDQTGKA